MANQTEHEMEAGFVTRPLESFRTGVSTFGKVLRDNIHIDAGPYSKFYIWTIMRHTHIGAKIVIPSSRIVPTLNHKSDPLSHEGCERSRFRVSGGFRLCGLGLRVWGCRDPVCRV